MAEFEVTRRLGAHRNAVFALVADEARVADWLPAVPELDRDGDAVRILLAGEPRTLLYNAEQDQMRAEWSLAGGGGYAGWLQLFDLDETSCDATVHLSLIDERNGDYGLGRSVEPALAASLERLGKLATDD
jgi:hypothetical protein